MINVGHIDVCKKSCFYFDFGSRRLNTVIFILLLIDGLLSVKYEDTQVFMYSGTDEIVFFCNKRSGSTISTLLHDKINPKDCQVLSLGDSGFLQFFRVVSSDYGKPRRWIRPMST